MARKTETRVQDGEAEGVTRPESPTGTTANPTRTETVRGEYAPGSPAPSPLYLTEDGDVVSEAPEGVSTLLASYEGEPLSPVASALLRAAGR